MCLLTLPKHVVCFPSLQISLCWSRQLGFHHIPFFLSIQILQASRCGTHLPFLTKPSSVFRDLDLFRNAITHCLSNILNHRMFGIFGIFHFFQSFYASLVNFPGVSPLINLIINSMRYKSYEGHWIPSFCRLSYIYMKMKFKNGVMTVDLIFLLCAFLYFANCLWWTYMSFEITHVQGT